MFDKKFRKRTAAGGMAAVMLFTGLLSSAAYARDGWTETQFLNNPVEVRMREFSFSDKANQQALAAGSIPTGLGHELTMTHRKIPAEPFAYGKWWLSNEGHAVKDAQVPLASDKSKTVKVDFSKAANHLLSCVQVHNGSVPGGAIPGVEGMTYPMIYGSQFFTIEAYLPTTNPNDYPAYILDHSASMGIENMKFYLLLMCMLHSYDKLTPEELKDDAHKTEYSMVCFEYTRLLENGVFTQRPESYVTDWTHVVNQIKGDLLPSQYPNNNESPNKAVSDTMRQWFEGCWNDALFMSQFGYDISQGMEGPGAEQTNIYVSIPLTEATLGDDGMYHRTWDYSAMQNTSPYVFIVKVTFLQNPLAVVWEDFSVKNIRLHN